MPESDTSPCAVINETPSCVSRRGSSSLSSITATRISSSESTTPVAESVETSSDCRLTLLDERVFRLLTLYVVVPSVFLAETSLGVFAVSIPGTVFSLFAPGLFPAASRTFPSVDSRCACSRTSAICIGRPDDFRPEVDLFPRRLGAEVCDVAGVINWLFS